MNKILLGLGALTAFTACTKPVDDTADTADTAVDCVEFDGATEIGISDDACGDAYPDAIAPTADGALVVDCDSAGWFVYLYTVGWSNGADLAIDQTGVENGWDETWAMSVSDSDSELGYWAYIQHEMAIVTTLGEVDDSHTLFQCNGDRKATLSYELTVLDSTGAESDCAVWGEDVSGFACTETSW